MRPRAKSIGYQPVAHWLESQSFDGLVWVALIHRETPLFQCQERPINKEVNEVRPHASLGHQYREKRADQHARVNSLALRDDRPPPIN
jgi:hypothetical protein